MKYPPLSMSLTVGDAAAAIAFYKKAFGAEERYRLTDPQSGKVGHAEILIGGSLLMLADHYPEYNKTPQELGGSPVRLSLIVEDVDAALQEAVAAGATLLREPSDQFYGFRTGSLTDPFGHEWMLSTIIEEVPPEEMQRRWNEMDNRC